MLYERMSSLWLFKPFSGVIDSQLRRRARGAVMVIIGLLVQAGGAWMRGNEPPTPLQIEQYRRDGSLAERVRRAKELGNHLVAPALVKQASLRLNRLVNHVPGPLPTPPSAWRGMPTKGTVNMLVLLVDFTDNPHDDTKNSREQIQARLFGDGDAAAAAPYESLRNFYRRSSYNQLELTGNVLGWYRPAYTRASIAQTAAGREGLIQEILSHYKALGHDFAQYDNNGDGEIDYFSVIWSGPDTGWSNFWWGYATYWQDSHYKLDGKTLGRYTWMWESNPVGGSYVPLVMIHETGHALGLPDYYDYLSKAEGDSIGPDGGVGGLDMMDSNWGDHNCFSKFLLDWIEPTVYTAAAEGVSLRAAGSLGDAAIVMPDAVAGNNFGEFFMVQNRKRVLNDSDYPADGLLIWHVDSRLDATSWDYLFNNSYTEHKLLRLMEADGLEEIERGGEANAGDYWRNGQTFGPKSFPSSSRYNGLWTLMGISSISNPGATMTCNVFTLPPSTTAPTGTPSTPTIGPSPTQDRLVYRWTIGTAADPDSGIVGYHLQVGTLPGAADFFDGNIGNVTSKIFPKGGQDGSTYYARVRAMNGVGLFTGWSGNSPGILEVYPEVPCATLDDCSLVFKTRGDAPWTSQSTVTHGTATAAQSGAIPDLSDSVLQTSLVGPGSLTFWWKVSSEASYDFLTFSMDGVPQGDGISGEVDWASRTCAIPAGPHILRWTYAKDEAVRDGQDRAWVDQVSYSGGTPPVLTAFSPISGTTGTRVTLTGTSFTGASAVRFNGAGASYVVVSDTLITATVPTGATSGTIAVTTPGGTATGSASFTVTIPAPTIAFFTPASGLVGTAVTITGSAFAGATAVQFNGTSATTYRVDSDTSITATVPAGTTTGTISVTNPAGTGTSAATFTVRPGDPSGDGVSDVFDLAILARAYGSHSGDRRWIAAADLNGDGVVDDLDLALFYGLAGF